MLFDHTNGIIRIFACALHTAPRRYTGEPVFCLVVGVPEPSVDMDTIIVHPPPPLYIRQYTHTHTHTHSCRSSDVCVCVRARVCGYERKKERSVLFNDALNTFYLRLYGVRYMVKDHSGSERGNPLPPHGLLFPISSKGSFTCIIPQTG